MLMGMDTGILAEQIRSWCGGNPFREAILMTQAEVAPSTFAQLKQGRYKPSKEMAKRIQDVMTKYPSDQPIPLEAYAAANG